MTLRAQTEFFSCHQKQLYSFRTKAGSGECTVHPHNMGQILYQKPVKLTPQRYYQSCFLTTGAGLSGHETIEAQECCTMFTRPIYFLEGPGYKTNKCIEEARQATSILHLLQVTQKKLQKVIRRCTAEHKIQLQFITSFFNKLFNTNMVLPLSSNSK